MTLLVAICSLVEQLKIQLISCTTNYLAAGEVERFELIRRSADGELIAAGARGRANLDHTFACSVGARLL
jgi:hypothetical protein